MLIKMKNISVKTNRVFRVPIAAFDFPNLNAIL